MTDNTPSYPAGWYADTNAPGTERYYDGVTWTAQVRPATTAPPEIAVTTAEPVAKAPWYKRKAIVIPVGIVAGLIVIGSIGSAIGAGKDDVTAAADTNPSASAPSITEEAAVADVTVPETTGLTAKEAAALIENAGLTVEFSADKGVVLDRDNWTVLSSTPTAGAIAKAGDTVVVNVEKTAAPAPAPAEPVTPVEPEKPAMTTAQSSAVRSAQSYLSFSAFSRVGLTQQLTSEYGEGFTPEDAEFAIAYLESAGAVDWNQEAAESAKSYLDLQGFSRDGLYEQLTSEYGEGFTPDQANFGLAAVGL
ncbi:Ltp family lipoprotein [Herbiconiux daphne]|uniref:Ltp family lipoprotein n=1 Tax=Herbiconiux daphne TaxID=2970914 RepID=A0ABT2H1I3_9MICO|nr:Ltp family lipoprotein [Herbiconiux daphne]MCS5733785.1 Ltp family lipoprotein [Herbiconiux daphne]